MQDIRKTGHVTYYSRYHIVWIPRRRRKVLVAGVRQYLKIKFFEVATHYPEIDLIEITIKPDHVHLLLSLPPRFGVPEAVRLLKTNTSKALKLKFDFLHKVYPNEGMWSKGYFMSTVGINAHTVQAYIQRQAEEDSGHVSAQLKLV